MLKELVNKENEFALSMISEYEKAIDTVKKDIASIEDKYHKLMEEESKALNEELKELSQRLKIWEDGRKTSTCLTKMLQEAPTTLEDAEEKIVDTIYEENNESPCNGSEENTEKEAEEEETCGEPSASEPVDIEEDTEVTEDWEVETEAQTQEEEEWPETPEKW